MNKEISFKKNSELSWLISLYLVLTFALPKINIYIGAVPLYFVDIISIFLIYRNINFKSDIKLKKIALFLLFMFIISQLVYLVLTNDIRIFSYNLIRHSIPIIGIFTFFPKIYQEITKKRTYVSIIKYSCLFTSIVLIGSSVPVTRDLIESLVSYNFLYPSAEKIFDKKSGVDEAIRGLSLIGVSNISGTIILFGLGIVIYFEKIKTSNILIILFTLAAATATYSRTVFISLILIFLFKVLISNINSNYKYLFSLIIISIFLNWGKLVENTKYLNFDRINKASFEIEASNENQIRGINERVFSYTQPFNDLQKKPFYLFSGATINSLRSKKSIKYFDLNVNNPDHSLFGRSFYIYGFLVSIIYMFILYLIWKNLMFCVKKRSNLFICIVPVFIWCFTSHGAITTPNGSAIFFLCLVLSTLIIKEEIRQ